MPMLADIVLDDGLNVLNNLANQINICSQEPANYTEATSTYSLGVKNFGAPGTAFGSPEAGTPSGRKVASTPVTDGSVTGTGIASHWAASHVEGTTLLAASTLAATQNVTSGNSWSLPSFDITIPAPA